jgi:hypothetical protein
MCRTLKCFRLALHSIIYARMSYKVVFGLRIMVEIRLIYTYGAEPGMEICEMLRRLVILCPN